jgi:hypothetical protein
MENPALFNKLSLHQKVLLVDDMGIELCSIEHYDHRIHLFAFNELFIEAYHNIETKQLEKIAVAEYGDLDKYLSRITISTLKKGRNRFQAPML